jgi:hypothetical protein
MPSISRLGGITADVFRADKPINCGITDASTHLRIYCGIICSVNNHDEYLRVSPKDIQWITNDLVWAGEWGSEKNSLARGESTIGIWRVVGYKR